MGLYDMLVSGAAAAAPAPGLPAGPGAAMVPGPGTVVPYGGDPMGLPGAGDAFYDTFGTDPATLAMEALSGETHRNASPQVVAASRALAGGMPAVRLEKRGDPARQGKARPKTGKAQVSGYEYPSTLDDKALLANRTRVVAADLAHRKKIPSVNFSESRRMFNMTTGVEPGEYDPRQGKGPQRVNHIREVVEDLMSVAMQLVPGAQCYVVPSSGAPQDEETARIFEMAKQESERRINAYVDSVETINQYADVKTRVISDAAIYGPGYVEVALRERGSTLESPALAALTQKLVWGPEDLRAYTTLSRPLVVAHTPAEGIVWQEGVPSAKDPSMRRVSRLRTAPTAYLRDVYGRGDIAPGGGLLGLDRTQPVEAHERATQKDASGLMETWEIEPFTVKRRHFLMGVPGAAGTFTSETETALLTYTLCTSGAVLERRVYDEHEVVIKLPFIPFYIKEGKGHPYGFGLPMMLRSAADALNAYRATMVEQSLNSVSPQAVAANAGAISDENRGLLDKVFAEGGIAWLEGLEEEADLKKYFHAFQFAGTGVSPALAQIINDGEASLRRMGQAVSVDDLRGTRSGSGVVGKMQAADRPKGYATSMLSESAEDVRERIADFGRIVYSDENADVRIYTASGYSVTRFNERQQHPVLILDPVTRRPMRDEAFVDASNPTGILFRSVETVIADTTQQIKARADGRGGMPVGMLDRLYFAGQLAQAGVFKSPATAREIALDSELRGRDDANAERDAQAARQQQSEREAIAARLAQQAGIGAPGMGAPGMDAPAGMAPSGDFDPMALAEWVRTGADPSGAIPTGQSASDDPRDALRAAMQQQVA